MKRFICLALALSLLLLCACTANTVTMDSNAQARLFAPEELSIGSESLRVLGARRCGENVFLYGYGEDTLYRFYSLNTVDMSVTEYPLEVAEPLSISGGEDGISVLHRRDDGYFISSASFEGAVAETPLSYDGEEGFSPTSFTALPGGYLVSSQSTVLAFSTDGTLIERMGPYEGAVSVLRGGDGEILIAYDDTETGGMRLDALDGALEVVKSYELKDSYTTLYDGADGTIFALSGGIIYRVNYKLGSRGELVSVSDSGGGAESFVFLTNNRFFSTDNFALNLWSPSERRGKTVLRLAAYGDDVSLLEKSVSAFNAQSGEYMIELVNYRDYDTSKDSGRGLRLLDADLSRGFIPDIYDASTLPSKLLADKSLIEPLDGYLEQGPIWRDDLFPVALSAGSSQGKLYELIPAFSVVATCGSIDVFGGTEDLSIEHFLDVQNEHPGEKLFGPEMTREMFLYYMLTASGDFIDLGEGTCSFSNPLFVSMLEYSMTLPVEYISAGSSQGYALAYSRQQLLLEEYLGEYALDAIMLSAEAFRDKQIYMGFPTNSGSGIAIDPTMRLSMSNRSAAKDGVWDYFCFLLSDDFQYPAGQDEPNIKEIPSLQDCFDRRYNYWADKYDDASYIATMVNGESIRLRYRSIYSGAKIELLSLINRAQRSMVYDEEIFEIVLSYVTDYYAGRLIAQQCAKRIDQAVKAYLEENYR